MVPFSAPDAMISPSADTVIELIGDPPWWLNILCALLAKLLPSNLEQSHSWNGFKKDHNRFCEKKQPYSDASVGCRAGKNGSFWNSDQL